MYFLTYFQRIFCMKHSVLFFIFAALPMFSWAQSTKFVMPKVGVVLRAQPNKGAEKLLNIPQDEEITIGDKAVASETIGGKKGAWHTCTYKGKSGYVFDGFLGDGLDGEGDEHAADNALLYKVAAESGVVLRAQPNKGAAKLALIKLDTQIYLYQEAAATETIGGKKGAWRKCEYGGKVGYIFDGFCTKM